ncbi:MAG: SMC-Scp complex subunit ScpB [Candidatus Zixiibacteriota bacterium]|nr:MAG: SMC-Scp complex subunit ScpB [candidate division Zixibacteria bacterium]
MNTSVQYSAVEALILASPEPLPARKIAGLLQGMTPAQVGQAVAALNNRYMEAGCSFRIREIAGGYQVYIVPEFTDHVREMFSQRRKMRLTRAALETLAIIAYRQPVARVDIEQIRGVASDGVIHNLLEKNMITIKGRASTVGKPLQYGTTDEFLKFFGLASLDDLPRMSEIEELIAENDGRIPPELLLGDDDGNGNGHQSADDGVIAAGAEFDDRDETDEVVTSEDGKSPDEGTGTT